MVPARYPLWLLLQAIAWPLALVAALSLPRGDFFTRHGMALFQVAWILSLASLVLALRAWRTLADAVTIARGLAIDVAATWILLEGAISRVAWLLLGLALAADLLDGYCARRFGATAGGALLDLETDQLAFVVLATLGFHYAGAPGTVFVVPGMRYAKVIAHRLCGVPVHAAPQRRGGNRGAKSFAALASLCCFAMLAPGLAPGVVTVLANVAALVLVWSYRTDFGDLVASRRERSRDGDHHG